MNNDVATVAKELGELKELLNEFSTDFKEVKALLHGIRLDLSTSLLKQTIFHSQATSLKLEEKGKDLQIWKQLDFRLKKQTLCEFHLCGSHAHKSLRQESSCRLDFNSSKE